MAPVPAAVAMAQMVSFPMKSNSVKYGIDEDAHGILVVGFGFAGKAVGDDDAYCHGFVS